MFLLSHNLCIDLERFAELIPAAATDTSRFIAHTAFLNSRYTKNNTQFKHDTQEEEEQSVFNYFLKLIHD